MVPETVREDLHLQGLPHGEGRLRERVHVQGVPHGSRAVREDLHVQGLPHGSRTVREDLHLQVCHIEKECLSKQVPYTVCTHGAGTALQEGGLHRLQASALHKDDPGQTVRAETSRVHGHPLRTSSRLRASAGSRVLPDALLQQEPLLMPEVLLRLN